jgi:hypothetical protein
MRIGSPINSQRGVSGLKISSPSDLFSFSLLRFTFLMPIG